LNFYFSKKKNIFSLKNNQATSNQNKNEIYSETEASISVHEIKNKFSGKENLTENNFNENRKNNLDIENNIIKYNEKSEKDINDKISNTNFNINSSKNMEDNYVKAKISNNHKIKEREIDRIQKYANADLIDRFDKINKNIDLMKNFTDNLKNDINYKFNNNLRIKDYFINDYQRTNSNLIIFDKLKKKYNDFK
jgi:hypothetical protein